MRKILFPLFVFVLILVATACAAPAAEEDAQVYTRVGDVSLSPGDAIPASADAPILTVTGAINAVNDPEQNAAVLDLATIESIGLVEYTVTDPFEERAVTYRGVLMSDLLDVLQVDEEAQTLHMVALNDYAIDVPIAPVRDYPLLFALQADGEYMQPDYRGPAMLVYPVDDFDFDETEVRRNWIWQIKAIEVQ